jgi:hypothetical protein
VTLAERLLALHAALEAADLPHAFGGAIALAFWTLEPRGTRDLDVNVFIPLAETQRLLAALPSEIDGALAATALASDGQARLWWDDTPVDVFLDYAPIHHAAARHRRFVPFEGAEIPVLAPVELAVFKAMFDRTKDWADIEAMVAAGSLDVPAVRAHVAELAGPDDPRLDRLAAIEAV